jgi:cytidine deaminase
MKLSSSLLNRRALLAAFGSSLAMCGLGSEAMNRIAPQADAPSPGLRLSPQAGKRLEEFAHSSGFTGQIPAAMVQELAKSDATNVSTLMIQLLDWAQTYSHAPISNYHVGAVARGWSGSLYLGMNVEIPQNSLGFSVHGEQSALSSAYMHGESGIAAIAVTAAPCGHCRQFMIEMSPDGEIEILVKGKSPVKLAVLLPMAFGPRDLGFQHGAFPVEVTGLAFPTASDNPLARAALDAATHAYAPYSGAVSGVGIRTKSQDVYKGCYLENAAFNPSLSPLQTALVQLILAGEEYAAITQVLLVEVKNAKISQASVTRAVLSAIAPTVQLQTIEVEKS